MTARRKKAARGADEPPAPEVETGLVRREPTNPLKAAIDFVRDLPARTNGDDQVKSIAINDLRHLLVHRTRPMGTRILVRRVEAKQTMSSGEHGKAIHIPQVYQELDQFAEILEVGPDVTHYLVGMVICMWPGAGQHLSKELALIEEKEVLGVVDVG